MAKQHVRQAGTYGGGGGDLDGAFLGVHFCWGKSASKSVHSEIGQRKESDKAQQARPR